MNNKFVGWWLKILLVILGLTILVSVGLIFYKKFQTQEKQSLVTVTSPTTAPTITNDKIYVNTKYGYQVHYPDEWTVAALNSGESVNQTTNANFRKTSDETPAESGFSIIVMADSENLALTDWLKQNPDNGTVLTSGEPMQTSTRLLNNLNWQKITNTSVGYAPTGLVKYSLVRNGNLYLVVAYAAEEKDMEQMLATLKFTD